MLTPDPSGAALRAVIPLIGAYVPPTATSRRRAPTRRCVGAGKLCPSRDVPLGPMVQPPLHAHRTRHAHGRCAALMVAGPHDAPPRVRACARAPLRTRAPELFSSSVPHPWARCFLAGHARPIGVGRGAPHPRNAGGTVRVAGATVLCAAEAS